MNQLRNRIEQIDAELAELTETENTTSQAITSTSDDLANVTRAGRHLRDLGTIAHSYDGVEWVRDAIGITAGQWAEELDARRIAIARVEDVLRDAKKRLKKQQDEIKGTIMNLKRERAALVAAEGAISGDK